MIKIEKDKSGMINFEKDKSGIIRYHENMEHNQEIQGRHRTYK